MLRNDIGVIGGQNGRFEGRTHGFDPWPYGRLETILDASSENFTAGDQKIHLPGWNGRNGNDGFRAAQSFGLLYELLLDDDGNLKHPFSVNLAF